MKRKILSTIAENFDPFLFQGPLLNRAKLFLHRLQLNPSITWDSRLGAEQLKEWANICKQVKNCPEISIQRFVGERKEIYNLICFTDSSKVMYGAVVYIQNVRTAELQFLLARNKIITRSLETKSMPSLELNAVVFGLEILLDLYKDIATDTLLCPVSIENLHLYTDSMVVLGWINGFTNKLESQSRLSVFVRNRLDRLSSICIDPCVHFHFVAGEENPADPLTREISYKLLQKSNYLTGPAFLAKGNPPSVMNVTVPRQDTSIQSNSVTATVAVPDSHLIPLSRFSSFDKLVRVHRKVLIPIKKFKASLCSSSNEADINLFTNAKMHILKIDQLIHFPDCVKYFKDPTRTKMPNLIKQLNLFTDEEGLLRVRSKFGRKSFKKGNFEPILLSRHSCLTKLIISDLHLNMNHSGKYAVLAQLRMQFYVPRSFSVVKAVIRCCNHCKRFNNLPVKLNQSPYREMRVSPPSIPFRYMYIDHLGPVSCRSNGIKEKIYFLCFSCMWSRAINIEICHDLSVKSFLRAFQMHVHQYGLPETVISDSGTSMVASANIITDFLKDVDTKEYLEMFDIAEVSFSQYYKGNPELGGLVESAVKLVKRLIFGSIKNNVLSYFDLEFLLSEIKSLINKRPVALKEATRDDGVDDVPQAITPEMLVRGHTLPSLNCIPDLHADEGDPDWSLPGELIKKNYVQLQKVRQTLLEVYNKEFEVNLLSQAVDRKNRYVPKKHAPITTGDIVLLKEKFIKPGDYKLAIVLSCIKNSQGEVTGLTVRMGATGEVVNRHSNSVIPLLQGGDGKTENFYPGQTNTRKARVQRKAALIARKKLIGAKDY